MNVMHYRQENAPTLVSLLSCLTIGASVTIEVRDCPTVFVGKIDTRNDVLRMCRKVFKAAGRTVRVLEIGAMPDYEGARLHIACF